MRAIVTLIFCDCTDSVNKAHSLIVSRRTKTLFLQPNPNLVQGAALGQIQVKYSSHGFRFHLFNITWGTEKNIYFHRKGQRNALTGLTAAQVHTLIVQQPVNNYIVYLNLAPICSYPVFAHFTA